MTYLGVLDLDGPRICSTPPNGTAFGIQQINMNPLNKIIFLSAFLALGFLLILLSCALYNNYHPLWVIFMFLVAPLPNILERLVEGARDDFLSFNGSNKASTGPFAEFCKIATSFFLVSGVALPIMFYHNAIVELGAMVMSILGGVIVYSDIVAFIWFFSESEEENDDFNF